MTVIRLSSVEESGHQLRVRTSNHVLAVTLCQKMFCDACLPACLSVCLPVCPVPPLDFVGMD